MLSLIQDKINTYLEFVESGQLAQMQTPKIPEAPDIHIALMLQYPPTNEATEFFGRVRELLAGMGMKFDAARAHAPAVPLKQARRPRAQAPRTRSRAPHARRET